MRMSIGWSITGVLSSKEGFADVGRNLENLLLMYRLPGENEDCPVERDEQINTAAKITSVLMATEVFQNAEEISIGILGHAHPGHQKAPDGAADDVSEHISISVKIFKYREE
jgi:hypothetical protein